MGAWGHRTFEEDDALDWLGDLIEHDDPAVFIRDTLQALDDQEYIDSLEGASFLAVCEVIYALEVGPREGSPETLTQWVAEHSGLELRFAPEQCANGLRRILGDASELNESWSESEVAESWRGGIMVLIDYFETQ